MSLIFAILILILAISAVYLSPAKQERTKNAVILGATTVASFSGLFLALELSKIETEESELNATKVIVQAAYEEANTQFGDLNTATAAGPEGIAKLKERVIVLGLDMAAKPLYSEMALRHIHPLTMQFLITGLKYSQYRFTELISSAYGKNDFNEQLTKYKAEIEFVRELLKFELKRMNDKITEDEFRNSVLNAFKLRKQIVFAETSEQKR